MHREVTSVKEYLVDVGWNVLRKDRSGCCLHTYTFARQIAQRPTHSCTTLDLTQAILPVIARTTFQNNTQARSSCGVFLLEVRNRPATGGAGGEMDEADDEVHGYVVRGAA